MTVSMIAAVGRNLEIGKNNALLWRLPGDLKFFKNVTLGKPVIMGRLTFESLPSALPGRRNIVLSGNPGFTAEGAEVFSSLSAALESVNDMPEVFIIGGAKLYSQCMAFADKLYLTEAQAEDASADAYFPAFDKSGWEREIIDRYDGEISYEHVLYTLKDKRSRG